MFGPGNAQVQFSNGENVENTILDRQNYALRGTGVASKRQINSATVILGAKPGLSNSQLRGMFAAQGVRFEDGY